MLILLDLILVPFGFTIIIVTFLTLKLKYHGKNIVKGKGLLILSPSGYESVKARGIEHLATFDNDFFLRRYFPFVHEVEWYMRYHCFTEEKKKYLTILTRNN